MKILFVPLAGVSLLCVVAAAQELIPNVAAPPIKMGLWQSTINVRSGMGPAGAAVTKRSCYTPDGWRCSSGSTASGTPTLSMGQGSVSRRNTSMLTRRGSKEESGSNGGKARAVQR
ncbi:MAG TPA: hypothetical protein VHZ25_01815 [Acidobacteriaceae bacterium]|jgi:hypothetical protein|nr:hypothetical protein [Acidobacteriaceae bacterium]